VFLAQVIEPLLYLFNDLLGSWRICFRPDLGRRRRGILVFNDHAVIDRIDAAAGYCEFMLALQFDARLFLNEGELFFGFDADLFFLICHRRCRPDLIGKLRCFVGDQLIERLKSRHLSLLYANLLSQREFSRNEEPQILAHLGLERN